MAASTQSQSQSKPGGGVVVPTANEMANEMFREGAFEYLDIPRVIEAAMEAHKADFVQEPSLDEIIEVDLWARRFVKDFASAKKEVFA